MKRSIIGVIILFSTISIRAQSQQSFKYQAIVRDNTEEPISNQEVGILISILEGSETGPSIYVESHHPTTNQFGLINIEIGNGTLVAGDFSNLQWGENDYYLKVEVDESGGTNYMVMGTSQILSVPVALHADHADTADYAEDNDWFFYNDDMYCTNPGDLGIGISGEPIGGMTSKLQIEGNYPSTSGFEDILSLWRGTTEPVTSGMGAGLSFYNEMSNGSYARTSRIISYSSDSIDPEGTLLFQTRNLLGNLNYSMFISGDGHIGIGSTFPTSLLTIKGTEYDDIIHYVNNDYVIANISGVNYNSGQLELYNYGNRKVLISAGWESFIDSDFFGIGTTEPTSLLEVNGNSSSSIIKYSNSNYDIAKLTGAENDHGMLQLYDHGTEKIHISATAQTAFNAGYVAIGELYPDAMLEVSASGSSSDLFMASSNDDNDGDLFVIKNSGNVGIGTSNPVRKLHIVGANPRIQLEASSSNPEINLTNSGDPSSSVWSIYKDGATDDLRFYQNGNRISIQSATGNVSIGTINPAGYRLNVAGTAYCSGGWQSSDIKFKKDIREINNSLNRLMQLHGVSYSWRINDFGNMGFPDGRHYGVIAQEIEQVLPEVVRLGPEGDKAVAYSELIPVMIEAMKELKAENDALKARIERLENK